MPVFLNRITREYKNPYKYHEDKLGPTFRTLYHMFRLMNRPGLPEKDQVTYANIARGQIGKDYLLILMVNCLTDHGRGFKPYVETYARFEQSRRCRDGREYRRSSF